MTVSALEASGLVAAWDEMRALAEWRRAEGHWDRRRADQARHWFEEEVRYALLARLQSDRATRAMMTRLGIRVAEGQQTPAAAALRMLEWLKREDSALDGQPQTP